jgi:small subunit ribosomal protein S21
LHADRTMTPAPQNCLDLRIERAHSLIHIGQFVPATDARRCSRCILPAENATRTEEYPLQILVRDNNVDQALRVLKKKMQREGVFREMKQRRSYEKPSERRNREKAEAIRRARKLARKKAQREGLIPAPQKKVREGMQSTRTSSEGAARPGPRRSY